MKTLYGVVIEWDGEAPMRRWYDRLSELTGGVAGTGDKKTTPLARRMREGKEAVVAQEGTIFCTSESCAHTIAYEAKEFFQARNVMVFETNSIDAYEASPEDKAIVAKLESVWSRKGRPPAKEMWHVMCLECLHAHTIEVVTPTACPKCCGHRLRYKRGTGHNYVAPTTSSLFEAWLTSRFANGSFCTPCVAVITTDKEDAVKSTPCPKEIAPHVSSIAILDGDDQRVVTLIAGSAGLMADLAQVETNYSRDVALNALDGVFASRTFANQKVVEKQRMETLVWYMKMHGDPLAVNFARQDQPDLLDAGYSITIEGCAQIMSALHQMK